MPAKLMQIICTAAPSHLQVRFILLLTLSLHLDLGSRNANDAGVPAPDER